MWDGKEGWTPYSCSSMNVIARKAVTQALLDQKDLFLQPVSFTLHSFGSKVICTVCLEAVRVYHSRADA